MRLLVFIVGLLVTNISYAIKCSPPDDEMKTKLQRLHEMVKVEGNGETFFLEYPAHFEGAEFSALLLVVNEEGAETMMFPIDSDIDGETVSTALTIYKKGFLGYLHLTYGGVCGYETKIKVEKHN